ncbi:MAG TPA: ABC transporter ATP-binding protein [Candidatus Acidoferrales bacterium]|nr:ABC transporter ATP-binding protein [Candidatus Acidoferrales bacterium]
MSAAAISVAGLGKRFRVGERERYLALRDVLARAAKAAFRRGNGSNGNSRAHIWALRDVTFEVREGETIGIIGRNGAGKSTLLKILAGITLPTEGWAEVRGRVGSLLEVGTGFHPELTGRENIYFSGSILGMKKREIDRKFDEITAFSGVETFLDTPLKHYSSGMQLRLAFSVAAHLEPEVLLVDEVLAVGDLEFQKKCLGKMEEVTRGGRTVLFVSHNMGAVRRICARGVWLEGGAVRRVGTAGECVDAYTASVEAAAEAGTGVYDLRARKDRFGSGFVLLRELRLLNSENQPRASVAFGEPFTLVFEFECLRATPSSFVGLTVLGADGTSVLGSHHYDSAEMRPLPAGSRHTISCRVAPNLLKPGRYSLQIGVLDYASWECVDLFYSAGDFTVEPGSGRFGRLADARPAYVQPVLEWKWE